MIININKIKKTKAVNQSSALKNKKAFNVSSYSNALYAGWGRVIKAYSNDCTIDLEMASGTFLTHIPIRSVEWAGSNSIGFGERDLPPIGCRVLMVFPDGMIENAFVLCSALEVLGDVGKKHKIELLASGKETEYLRIREGGLKETYDKSTGEWKIEVNNATINIDASGKVVITPAAGQNIELAGNTKTLVTHTELNTALQNFIIALNAHVHSGVTSGGASTAIPTPMTLNISSAEAIRLETS